MPHSSLVVVLASQGSAGGFLFIMMGIFLLIGLILLYLGFAFFLRKRASLQKLTESVTGTVTELFSQRMTGSRGGYYTGTAPIVSFRTQSGEDMQFRSSVFSSPPAYQVGQEVTVIYDPFQPQTAIIRSSLFLEFWFVPLILWGLGTIFSLVGIILLFAALHSQ